MYRRDFVISTFACVVGLSTPSCAFVQKKTIEPDLAALVEGKGLKIFNRSLRRPRCEVSSVRCQVSVKA